MSKICQLIKRSYTIWLKKRWLKLIAKECDKFIKYKRKSDEALHSINVLKRGYELTFKERIGFKK